MLHRRWQLAAVAVAAVAAAGTTAWGAPRATGPGSGPAGPLVTLSGQVEGLHPGATLSLPITVTNTQAYDVRLTAVRVAVGDAAVGCAAANLSVSSWQGPTLVAARAATVIRVPIVMPDAVPDQCAGQQFPLTYTGDAEPARTR